MGDGVPQVGQGLQRDQGLLGGQAAEPAEQELDELPDASHEVGVIEWIDYRNTAELSILPPIGPALAALADPYAAVTDTALDAVTDANYTWV
ncbi:hypothetical protein ACFYZ4_02760 [Streptomyces sp. NPDC001513]|uniref:hypothetical protein n=1 Tax=Streptomyces sp. NPDC001513 TaxID=3364580 RepID=UPI0036A82CDD